MNVLQFPITDGKWHDPLQQNKKVDKEQSGSGDAEEDEEQQDGQ